MSTPPPNQPSNASVSQLMERTVNNIQALFRDELRLAQAEITDDAKRIGVRGALLGAGALLGLFAFSQFLEAIAEVLEEIMPDWLVALLLSAILGGLGIVLAKAGRERLKQSDLVPRQTLDSLREEGKIV